MSSEIDHVALLLNATGWVYCWCQAMRLPERVSGASIGL